jgi:predicted hydrocarbon binding protein
VRYIKISQDELIAIRKLYESMMSSACHGLFFREGRIIGNEISVLAMENEEKFFEKAGEELKSRGWVKEIEFNDKNVVVKGSVEAAESPEPTCHRLRGIIRHLYEVNQKGRMHCIEEKCEGMGDQNCIFKIELIEPIV